MVSSRETRSPSSFFSAITPAAGATSSLTSFDVSIDGWSGGVGIDGWRSGDQPHLRVIVGTSRKIHQADAHVTFENSFDGDVITGETENEDGTKTIRTVILELAELLNSAIGELHVKTLVSFPTLSMAVTTLLIYVAPVGRAGRSPRNRLI